MSAELVVVVPQPSRELDVHSVCDQIEAWAMDTSDVGALKHNKAKLAAIDTYLEQTSIEGRSQIAATMRRLEVRIGDILGEAQHGGSRGNQYSGGKSESTDLPLSKDEKADYRKMARHAEIVEEVIANSTDEKPATRASVISMIDRSPEAIAERQARAKAKAEGHPVVPSEGEKKLAEAMDDGGALELARWRKKFGTAVGEVTGVARNFTVAEIVANSDADLLEQLQRSSDRVARLLDEVTAAKREARQLRAIKGSK